MLTHLRSLTLIGSNSPMQIDWHSLTPIDWSWLMQTGSNLLKRIRLSLLRLIDSNLPMLTD